MQIVGIHREKIFCNHAIVEDRAILEASIGYLEKGLRSRGIDPKVLFFDSETLGEHGAQLSTSDVIFNLAQGERSLSLLEEMPKRPGVLLWNAPRSIQNCFRNRLARHLEENNLSSVEQVIGNPKNFLSENSENNQTIFSSSTGYWIKRGDYHALNDADVVYAADFQRLRQRLFEFAKRDILEIVVQRHIVGKVFKFYGVTGGFFQSRTMSQPFRDEPVYDFTPDFPEQTVKALAERLGKIMNLEVFGGDVIITPTGEIHLIDVNDWPSFRSCRDQAAQAIAQQALSRLYG